MVRFTVLAACASGIFLTVAGWRYAYPPATRQAKARAESAAPIPGTGATPLQVESEDATTLTVRHAQGVATIPRQPQRVAVLGWNDEVVALGIHPVAASGEGWRGFAAYLREGLDGAVMIDGTGGSPDLEALAACHPDVIVAASVWQNGIQALSRIAPTVVLQPAQSEWRQRFRDLGLVLNRREVAEARLAQVEQRIAAAKAAIHARIGNETVAMVRVFAREYRLYGRGYSGPLLYEDLGLAMPQMVKDSGAREVTRMSIEGLSRLDADHILLMTEEHLAVSFQVRDRLAVHPLWAQLPAVRAGHVSLVPDMLMRGGIISRELTLDLLVKALAP